MTEATNSLKDLDKEQWIADKFADRSVILVFAVLGILLFFYRITFAGEISNNQEHWGQFGDLLGGVLNPIISLFTLMVATKVWQLQRRELEATKKALEQQVKESVSANEREEKKKDEQLFMSVLDKVSSSSLLVADTFGKTLEGRYINQLTYEIWQYGGLYETNFASAYGMKQLPEKAEGAQLRINEIVELFQPQVASYVHMVTLVLRVLSSRIFDRKLFSEIFCAQIGQPQLSLLCLLSCATQHSELKSLIQGLNLHTYLPQNEYDQHIELGWFNEAKPQE